MTTFTDDAEIIAQQGSGASEPVCNACGETDAKHCLECESCFDDLDGPMCQTCRDWMVT